MMEQRVIDINVIVADPTLMMRVELNQKTVVQYAEFMRDGCEFPPIDVVDVDGELLLVDGFHRLGAYKRRHETKIKAYVHQGTRDDAVLLAVQCDAHTSLQRSSADKRKCVHALLTCETWRERSSLWISQQAGVSDDLVARERKKTEINFLNKEVETPVSRVGKDGKRRPATKTKKPTADVALVYKPPPPLPQLTREQIGAPPPELENEQDPDSPPGVTRAQAFTQKHGYVHLVPLATKTKLKNETATKDMCLAIRDFGKAAEDYLKRDLIEPEVFFATLDGMDSKALWRSKFAKQLQALRKAFESINRCLELLQEHRINSNAAE